MMSGVTDEVDNSESQSLDITGAADRISPPASPQDPRKPPREWLGDRGRIGPNLRRRMPQPDQGFGQLDRRGDAIDDRQAVFAGERGGEVGHAGAAEHDAVGAVLGFGPGNLRRELAARAGGGGVEREHPDLAGGHAGPAADEPLFYQGGFRRP